jgi:molybdenum cofactor cytidylyltransferase
LKISAIILAAGRSTRFAAGPKLVAIHAGQPLIRCVVSEVAATSCEEIILVTAPGGHAVVDAAGQGRWRTVIAHNAERGMTASIQAGIQALAFDCDGALIVLADMPCVTAPLMTALCETFRAAGGSKIVFPQRADGRQGNPVLWPRAMFPKLMQLSGDSGGKDLITAHRESCVAVMVTDKGAYLDVDTVEDLHKMRGDGT